MLRILLYKVTRTSLLAFKQHLEILFEFKYETTAKTKCMYVTPSCHAPYREYQHTDDGLCLIASIRWSQAWVNLLHVTCFVAYCWVLFIVHSALWRNHSARPAFTSSRGTASGRGFSVLAQMQHATVQQCMKWTSVN